jgi:hypothetical protein
MTNEVTYEIQNVKPMGIFDKWYRAYVYIKFIDSNLKYDEHTAFWLSAQADDIDDSILNITIDLVDTLGMPDIEVYNSYMQLPNTITMLYSAEEIVKRIVNQISFLDIYNNHKIRIHEL